MLIEHCGTLPYMSPELINKKSYLGKPVDIWALGVMLYKMVSGFYPFKGNNPFYKSIKIRALKI